MGATGRGAATVHFPKEIKRLSEIGEPVNEQQDFGQITLCLSLPD